MKRDLYIQGKRHVYTCKETYIGGQLTLSRTERYRPRREVRHICPKRPMYIKKRPIHIKKRPIYI